MSLRLSDKITVFPVSHGKAVFAMEMRKLLWDTRFDCIAFAFPASLRGDCMEGIEKLPAIHALSISSIHAESDGKEPIQPIRSYLPFDPCDAYIEGMRQAAQRKIPQRFLEDDALLKRPRSYALPDAYLLPCLGVEQFYELSKQFPLRSEDTEWYGQRTRVNYRALRFLEQSFAKILFLCDFPILHLLEPMFQTGSLESLLAESTGVTEARAGEKKGKDDNGNHVRVSSFPIKPGLLYFALGELPFYAGEQEKERQNPLARPLDYLELVKKVFIDTRNHYLSKEGEVESISVKKVQIALTFLRNLAVGQGRLTPDLMDMVTAAKGVFGASFAAKVLESSRYYPFFDPFPEEGYLETGISHIQEPGEEEPAHAFNILEDGPKVWKTIRLRKEPAKKQQQRYRYSWDPSGMCSHFPEDDRIEGFNRSIRRKSQEMILQAFAKVEKLSSSFKDGIDIRETLRNWHNKTIYVKEIPPSRGKIDTVVIIFDEAHDDRYPNRATWYAEHKEESTLTFYATDPFSKMIGPGIAEAEYGGLSLLFPPRPVPDIFSHFSQGEFQGLNEQLLFGALLHSDEKIVAYVSAQKPDQRLRHMARRFRKRLLWVPLRTYSSETLRRLRKFHILNGREVRSWAARFIPE